VEVKVIFWMFLATGILNLPSAFVTAPPCVPPVLSCMMMLTFCKGECVRESSTAPVISLVWAVAVQTAKRISANMVIRCTIGMDRTDRLLINGR